MKTYTLNERDLDNYYTLQRILIVKEDKLDTQKARKSFYEDNIEKAKVTNRNKHLVPLWEDELPNIEKLIKKYEKELKKIKNQKEEFLKKLENKGKKWKVVVNN